jgi:hypothetical protein
MSMMGRFREISEEVLGRLRANPALIDTVVLADLPGDHGTSDFDTVFGSLSAKDREMMRAQLAAMTPEQRARTEGMLAKGAADIRSHVARVRPQGGGGGIPRSELGESASIEKAWHGLHYLLCGSAKEAESSLGQVVLGGTEIGTDLGYGPARYLTSAKVQELAAALSLVTTDKLLERYDSKKMERLEIYPGAWEEPENREWLAEAFAEVLGFYTRVAARGNAVLLYLS